MQPYLISKKCPAQKDLCRAIQACPTGAVNWVADAQEPLGGRIEFNYDECIECEACANECCGNAIELR